MIPIYIGSWCLDAWQCTMSCDQQTFASIDKGAIYFVGEPWCHIVGINSSPAPTCIDEMMGSKYGLTTSELYDHYGNRGHNAKVWHAIGIMLALLMSTVLLILVGILWRAEIR